MDCRRNLFGTDCTGVHQIQVDTDTAHQTVKYKINNISKKIHDAIQHEKGQPKKYLMYDDDEDSYYED